MKICTVTYRALRTGHGYNNIAVEATAQVEDGETADDALFGLRAWVDRQVDERLKADEFYEQLSNIRDRVGYEKRELERLEKRVAACRDLLKDRTRLADLARENGLGGDALLLMDI